MNKIAQLAIIFTSMVQNASEIDGIWKNIPLGHEAFVIMQELPDSLPGEYETPADKSALLGQMLDQMDETMTPRFCIQVREYMQSLDPNDSGNSQQLAQLRDYIDLDLPMDEYCAKYGKMLRFDPVERTPEMEEVIEAVERECTEVTADLHRGMGFCFSYWHAKAEILKKYGINWHSPAVMNPCVIFD